MKNIKKRSCNYCDKVYKYIRKDSKFCSSYCRQMNWCKTVSKEKRYKWRNNNKEKYKQLKQENIIKRRKNIVFRKRESITRQLYKLIKYKRINKTTEELVGCLYKELMNHLLCTFLSKYDRLPNNNDKIETHHIYWNSWCDTEQELINNQHYTNLCWLLKSDHQQIHLEGNYE